MPNLEEYCEVRTNQGVFRDWTSVAVNWHMTTNPKRTFQLQLVEPGQLKNPALLRLKPGDDIDISLAGKSVIKNGKIFVRQASFDANRHGVQVNGTSKAGEITDTAVEIKGSQFRDYDLSAIGNTVLKRYGLKLEMVNPPKGATERFRNIVPNYGETVWEFIERLARQRDCFLWTKDDGTIAAGLPDEGSGFMLEEGRNILAANCTITDLAAETRLVSQMAGSDEQFGSPSTQISATSRIESANNTRVQVGLAEEPLNQNELMMRTNRENRDLLASMIQIQVVHKGWFKPGMSELWTPGESVTLKSPSLVPVGEGSLDLRVYGVTYSQDSGNGTITTLDLVNQATFAQTFMDAKSSDGWNNLGATEAKPS